MWLENSHWYPFTFAMSNDYWQSIQELWEYHLQPMAYTFGYIWHVQPHWENTDAAYGCLRMPTAYDFRLIGFPHSSDLVLKLGNPLDSPAYLQGSWICPFGKVSEASKIERKTPWPLVIRTLTALMRSFLWGPTWGPTGCFREPNETPRKWGMIPPKHGRSERDFWQPDVNRIW